jgi:hypothetical protein
MEHRVAARSRGVSHRERHLDEVKSWFHQGDQRHRAARYRGAVELRGL